MKIAVISDTHIPASCDKLPGLLIEKIKGADLIVHAGDLTEPYVLDELNKIARTEAVLGNMDSRNMRGLLPEKKVLELENFKIGIIHGYGPADNLFNYIQDKFKDEKLDCVIYGHSHKPGIDNIGGTIYFNPGSPTEKIFAPYSSFGILEIDKELKAKIVRLEE